MTDTHDTAKQFKAYAADALARHGADTDESVPVRERCIDAMMGAEQWSSFFSRNDAGKLFDTILTELQEPSEGMLSQYPHDMRKDCAAVWQNGIQHIREGGS